MSKKNHKRDETIQDYAEFKSIIATHYGIDENDSIVATHFDLEKTQESVPMNKKNQALRFAS